jgi:amino acid adenylation domain-containing protein
VVTAEASIDVGSKCIHELFDRQAEKTPDAVALVFGKEEISCRELKYRTNQLANYLRQRGVRQGDFVGVCMDRSPELVVSLLGILKAGAAYVAMDPAYPRDRLAFMVQDSRLSTVLTSDQMAASFAQRGAQAICPDTDREAIIHLGTEAPQITTGPLDVAYVIYTSGSTGKPKGVLGLHQGVINRCSWMWDLYPFSSDEICCQKTALSFVDSVWEIFGPLLQGITNLIIPEDLVVDPRRLIDCLDDKMVTRLVLVPSLLRAILDAGGAALKLLPRLRYCISSGEALTAELALRCYEKLPDVTILNLYGSTEVSADVACYEVPRQLPGGRVLIGRPISNTQIYIVDTTFRPCPETIAGEILVGGAGLARGYLNRPDLTAASFIPGLDGATAGERLYKMGDLGRYLADGNIEFLGRIDDQVKIRGHRIELGEIGSTLRQHPAVHEAVVLARRSPKEYVAVDGTGGGDEQRLVAYVVADPEAADVQEIGNELETQVVTEWRNLYDVAYTGDGPIENDDALEFSIWNSSYTGLPIPADEMRAWQKRTIERIKGCKPDRIWEIGCGTGLLLLPIAPQCSHYLGTDISERALDFVRHRANRRGLTQVALQKRRADDFGGGEPGPFDMVVLNSVAQYFPGLDYLQRVLTGAVAAVSSGGAVFVGDVRSFPLLQAFHTSVELHGAADDLDVASLRERIRRRVAAETELVVGPDFFRTFCQEHRRLSGADILLKRGRDHNEMTRFRYDVVLHVGDPQEPLPVSTTRHWSELNDLGALKDWLRDQQPPAAQILGIPNARVHADQMSWQALTEAKGTAGQFRERVPAAAGLEPESLWELGEALGYAVCVTWSSEHDVDCVDVLLERPTHDQKGPCWVPGRRPVTRTPSRQANNPLSVRQSQRLGPALRVYLQSKLPEYMVPSAFVMLERLPLTPSGKVDRLALPAPDTARPALKTEFAPPRSPLEEQLSLIWCDVLSLDRVGIHDDFFDLGGESLLVLRLWNGIEKSINQGHPVNFIYQHTTIAQMAAYLDCDDAAGKECDRSRTTGSLEKAGPRVFGMGYGPTLARYLEDVSVYPLGVVDERLRHFDFGSIEEMATAFNKVMRNVQKEGPYTLCGFCWEGLVTLEMARQLHEQGQEVALLILIEAPLVDRNGRIDTLQTEVRPGRFVHHLLKLAKTHPKLWRKYSAVRLKRAAKKISSRFRKVTEQPGNVQTDFPLARAARAYVVDMANIYSGRAVFVVARDSVESSGENIAENWRKAFGGSLDVRIIPGDHDTMFREPHVHNLIKELRELLF